MSIQRAPRKLKLSIRFLLLLVGLAAIYFAWFSWKLRKAGIRDQFVKAIVKEGAEVAFLDQFDSTNSRLTPYVRSPTSLEHLLNASLGTNPFRSLASITWNKKEHWEMLRNYPFKDEIVILRLEKSLASDADLQHIADYRHTRVLNLEQTAITNQGLESIRGFDQLEELWLEGTSTTDQGIQTVVELSHLSALDIRRTQVTDEGLSLLTKLPKLSILYVDGKEFTQKGWSGLRDCPTLSTLWIEFPLPGHGDISPVLDIPSLWHLTLEGSEVNDEMLRCLLNNKHLRTLQLLRCTQLSDHSIDLIMEIPNLEQIQFRSAGTVSKAALDKLRERYPEW